MKKKRWFILAVLLLLCASTLALAACAETSTPYYALTLATPDPLPTHVLSVSVISDVTDENGVAHYFPTKTSDKFFTRLEVWCELGYEAEFTVTISSGTVTPTLIQSATSIVRDGESITHVRYLYQIDNALFDGDETLRLNFAETGCKIATYQLSFAVDNGDGSVEALDAYDGFTLTVKGREFTFQDLISAAANQRVLYLTYGDPIIVEVQIAGKTLQQDNAIRLLSFAGDCRMGTLGEDSGTYYEIEGDTVRFSVIPMGEMTLKLDLNRLNKILQLKGGA